jgi:hypothetical protein
VALLPAWLVGLDSKAVRLAKLGTEAESAFRVFSDSDEMVFINPS